MAVLHSVRGAVVRAGAALPQPDAAVGPWHLTTIVSIRVGARYEEATSLFTPALDARVDAIARSLPGFHFGRFDVRFESVAALQRGVFTIIELNGAGAEAIHFWDPKLSLRQSFAGVLAKQRLIFDMADVLRRRGVRRLASAWLRQQKRIAHYPPSN